MTVDTALPTTQTAVVVKHASKDWLIEVDPTYPVPALEPGQALVRLTHTGVCHSDLSGINGSWERKITCDVPGHEGVGRIVAYHGAVDAAAVPPLGTRVGVPLIRRPCTTCAVCLLPDGEVMCPNTGFHGLQCNGTYQQYIAVYTSYLVPLPESKGAGVGSPAVDEDALFAPVLCGGVTAYKALKKSGARAGEWVVVAGAGGGLGSFAVQYGAAMGMRVIGVDTGAEKRDATLRRGGEAFVDYAEGSVAKEVLRLTGGAGAKAVLVLAPVEKTYNEALEYVGYQGSVVCVGIPHESVTMAVSPGLLMHRDISVKASVVGTRADIAEALDFVVRGLVKPDIVVHPIDDIVDIYRRMERNEISGRAVLKL